jgi:hypothetical protein
MVKVKEKYFKTKYRPAGILCNVNAVIYFKLKLQLKFRNNKDYTSIIVTVCRTNRGHYNRVQLYFMRVKDLSTRIIEKNETQLMHSTFL